MVFSCVYVAAFVAGSTLPLWQQHAALHGGLSLSYASVSLFCSINTLICIWELALYYHRRTIKAQFAEMKRLLPAGGLPSPMFLFEHVSLSEVFSLVYWSKVWSTYSLMDPSYSDSTTFGFWIDVGNGHVTLLPSILFGVGMTWDVISARLLGTMGIVYFWQMMYGAVLYLSSYFFNERWKGRPGLDLVIVSNGIWVVCPLVGIWISFRMIQDDSFRVVRG